MMIGHCGPRDDDDDRSWWAERWWCATWVWHDDVIGHCGPIVGGMTVALIARRRHVISDTIDGQCGLSGGITWHYRLAMWAFGWCHWLMMDWLKDWLVDWLVDLWFIYLLNVYTGLWMHEYMYILIHDCLNDWRFIDSFSDWLGSSTILIDSLIQWLRDCSINWLTASLAQLIVCFSDSFIDFFVDWFIYSWMIDCLERKALINPVYARGVI